MSTPLRYFAVIGWIMVGFSLSARGQSSPTPVPPPGPLLAKPESAQWQVTVSMEKDAGSMKSATRAVAFIKSITLAGNLRHEETKYASGDQLSFWCRGEDEFYKNSSSDRYFVCPSSDEQFYIANPKQLFPELSWISAAHFIGRKNVNGKPCLVFSDSPPSPSSSPAADLLGPETVDESYYKKADISKLAYINEENRLPVYFQDGASGYFYQFGPDPSSTLALPDEIVAMLKARDEQTKRLSQEPARS